MFRIVIGKRETGGQKCVITRDAEKAETDNEQTCHNTRIKCRRKALRESGAGGFGGTNIGAHRNVHADIAGRARQRRPDEITDGNLPAQYRKGQYKDH